MTFFESLETHRDLERYEMILVTECGEHDVNGIYFFCTAPHGENTVDDRYIRKPHSKSSTFFVFNEERTILYRESPIESYPSRVAKYDDEDSDYSEEEEPSEDEDADLVVDFTQLTSEERDFFVKYYGALTNDIDLDRNYGDDDAPTFGVETILTQPRLKHLRKFLDEYSKYQVVLYKLNQDDNKWECVEGKAPAPKVTFVDNKHIEWKEKDYVPTNVANESTIGLKYELIYELFFDELCTFLVEILHDTEHNIFESKLICNIVKEYLFCYHQSCGMMRCLTRGRWTNPYEKQWILFFCNICTKKWAHYIEPSHRGKYEVFPPELISNVKFKYGVEVNGYKLKEIGGSIRRDDLGTFDAYDVESFYQNVEPFPMLIGNEYEFLNV